MVQVLLYMSSYKLQITVDFCKFLQMRSEALLFLLFTFQVHIFTFCSYLENGKADVFTKMFNLETSEYILINTIERYKQDIARYKHNNYLLSKHTDSHMHPKILIKRAQQPNQKLQQQIGAKYSSRQGPSFSHCQINHEAKKRDYIQFKKTNILRNKTCLFGLYQDCFFQFLIM